MCRISFNAKIICRLINLFRCAITAHLGYYPVNDTVIVTSSEAVTTEGRCSVITGNGPLIWDLALAREFKTSAQLIELLESRGVLTDAAALDCLRREMKICSPEHH